MWTNHSTRTVQSIDRSNSNDSLEDVNLSVRPKLRTNGSTMTPISKVKANFVTPTKKQLRTPSTVASTPSSSYCPSSEPSSAPIVTPVASRSHENNYTRSISYSSQKDDLPTASRTTMMRNEFQSSLYESEIDTDLSKGALFKINDDASPSPQSISSSLLAPPSPQGSGSFRTVSHLQPQSRSSSVEKHDSSSFSMSEFSSNTTRQRQKSLRRNDSINGNAQAMQDMSNPVNNSFTNNNYYIKPASSFEAISPDKTGYNSSKDRKSYNTSPIANGSSRFMSSFSTPSKVKNKRNKSSKFSLKNSKILPFLMVLFGLTLTGVGINLFFLRNNDEVHDVPVVNDVKLQVAFTPDKNETSKQDWIRPRPVDSKKVPFVRKKNPVRIHKNLKFEHNTVIDDHEALEKKGSVTSSKKNKKRKSLPFHSFHRSSDQKITNVAEFNMYGEKKSSPGHPRLFNIEGSSHQKFESPQPRAVQEYPAEFSDNTQFYSVLPSDDTRLRKMEIREPLESKECVPMQEWQTTFNPSCNGMHELDLVRMEDPDQNGSLQLFGKNGFWRNAWRVDLLGENQRLKDRESVVLKTLR